MMTTSTHSLSREASNQRNFSSSIHKPAREPGIRRPCKEYHLTHGDIFRLPTEVVNPLFDEKLALRKFNKPYFKRKQFDLTDEFWRVVITAFNLIADRPCWAGNRKLAQLARVSVATATKYKLLAEYLGLFDVEGREGKGAAHLTDLIRAGNSELADRLLYSHLRRRTDFNSRTKSSYRTCSSVCQSKMSTDPEPEPIQEANEGRMCDNVYSDKAAETPAKTPIPERSVPVVLTEESKPSEEQAWAFREAILYRCRVSVELAIVFWLVWKLRALRWSQADFLRYWQHEHHLERYNSPMAGLQDILLRYYKRGPTLDAIPPEKRAQAVECVASDQRSAFSNQPAESPPDPPRSRSTGSLKQGPANESPPKGPPCSPDRVLELLAEEGIDNDIGFLAWVPANKKCEWPADERNVRALIRRYCASLDRNRSSASSDAASSSRASSDTSGAGAGGLTTPVSDADLSPGDKSGVQRVWSGGSLGEP